MNKTNIIAVTGKGGSGKTAFVSLLVKLLRDKYKILAVDADSGGGLIYALGVEVEKTLGDFRKAIIEDPISRREMEDRHVRHVIADLVTEGKGFSLLAMGRGEGPGCYCSVNDLLKYGIESLAGDYDIVVIDCEAGPEQINRRIVKRIDVLIIIVDNSIRSVQVASVIAKIAEGVTVDGVEKIGMVLNKCRKKQGISAFEEVQKLGLPILGCIPENHSLAEYDSNGKSLLELPGNAQVILAVQEIIHQLGFD